MSQNADVGARKTQPINLPAQNSHNGGDERRYRRCSLWAQWAQVIATALAAVAGISGLLFLSGTLTATKEAADAARDQARVAATQAQDQHTQLELTQRAWISVGRREAGPITSTREGGGGLEIPISLILTNHGNTVAENVTVHFDLIPYDILEKVDDVIRRQQRLCQPLRGGYVPHNLGMIIFPNDTRPSGADLILGLNTITQGRREYEQMFRMPKGWADHIDPSPTIIGCVNYTFALDNPQYHQTGFVYNVFGYDPQFPRVALGIKPTSATLGWRLSDYDFGDAFYAD